VDLTTELTLIGRMVLGAFLGYVIGFEREYRGKAAGERTFGLLALGAAGVTALGVLTFPVSAERVIAGVVTGVGFLGAGLIFRERGMGQGQILGLTTAASSWAAAAVGILAGAGAYLSSVIACVAVLVILEINRFPLYRRIDPSKVRRDEAPGGRRFGTTAFPTAEDATDEPMPPEE
jgi:putative Mg2+ transporter-C (MgtC) family protein